MRAELRALVVDALQAGERLPARIATQDCETLARGAVGRDGGEFIIARHGAASQLVIECQGDDLSLPLIVGEGWPAAIGETLSVRFNERLRP